MKTEYGLIGRQIGHSFSANYFNEKFARENIDVHYSLFDLNNIEELREVIKNQPDLVGLNVTSPYKRDVIALLDDIDDDAREMNSVNVIKVIHNGGQIRLKGFNSDCEGFRLTLAPLLPERRGKRALILGTGGAASAVKRAFEKEGVEYLQVSRSPRNGMITYDKASELIPEMDIIVNATPVGMEDKINEAPPLDYDKINSGHLLYDLIYNPAETLFLKKGKEKGGGTVNGLQMLINQADLSWKIWTGS